MKYHHRMQALVQEAEKKRSSEVSKLEEQMRSCVTSVVENQDRVLRETEEFVYKVPRKLLKKHQRLEVSAANTNSSNLQNRGEQSSDPHFISRTGQKSCNTKTFRRVQLRALRFWLLPWWFCSHSSSFI